MIALVLCGAWIFVTKKMGGVTFRLQSRSGDANCGQKTLIFKQFNDHQALLRLGIPRRSVELLFSPRTVSISNSKLQKNVSIAIIHHDEKHYFLFHLVQWKTTMNTCMNILMIWSIIVDLEKAGIMVLHRHSKF